MALTVRWIVAKTELEFPNIPIPFQIESRSDDAEPTEVDRVVTRESPDARERKGTARE